MTIARLLASCTLAFAFSGLSPAKAAEYPDHPIRVIVPTAPGSTADLVARVIAEGMGKALGQALIVENLTGAAGIPGTRQLVSSKPDGYTVAIISSNHAINPSLYKNLPYDSVHDITPISILGSTPLVLVVRASSPYKTVGDLIKAAKEHPGKVNYGSSGTGSVLHLAGELLKSKAAIDMTHIPYRGGNALITDVLSGQIDTAFLATPSVMAQIQAGQLRALAVSTPDRVGVLPNVPTLAQAGAPGYAYDAWIALIGPAKLPPVAAQRLQQAAQKAAHDDAALASLTAQGFVPSGSDSNRAATVLNDEISKTKVLVDAAGIRPE